MGNMLRKPTNTTIKMFQVMRNEYNQVQLCVYDTNLQIVTALVGLFNSLSEYANYIQQHGIQANQIISK